MPAPHVLALPEGALASQYTLLDNMFHSAFGGSFLNHIFLVAAAPPPFPAAPANVVAQLDQNGKLVKDGAVSPDGFAVNTSFGSAHIRDGLSQTLAFAEVQTLTANLTEGLNPNSPNAPIPNDSTALTSLGGTFGNDSHVAWCNGNSDQTGVTAVFPPNTRVAYVVAGVAFDIDFITVREGDTATDFIYAAVTSRSHHSGLVQVLLLDGSSRAVSNHIDLRTWRALATRAGREPVSEF